VVTDIEALVRAEPREPVTALVRKLVPELVGEERNGHAGIARGSRRRATLKALALPSESGPKPAIHRRANAREARSFRG
jgi:hypothetical protein